MPPDRRQRSEGPATPIREAAIRLLFRVSAPVSTEVDCLISVFKEKIFGNFRTCSIEKGGLNREH